MKKRILLLAAALCLLCSGCGGGLLAVGLLVYHETVTLRQGLGVLVCLAGIYLVGA